MISALRPRRQEGVTLRPRLTRGLVLPTAVLSLGLGAAFAVLPAPSASAAIPAGCTLDTSAAPLSVECNFTTTTTFTVPGGVSQLRVTVSGGAGAANWTTGGAGATVTADVNVTAGDALNVTVGVNDGNSEGGGASDIRTGSAMSSALVVGGGGGAGGTAGGGGRGGSAGTVFAASCAPGSGGTNASTPPARGGSGTGGAGATCTSGGAGGITGGGAGAPGAGGTASTIGNRGGGGGAGYFGGGGGGGWAGSGATNGGGGGGGSSYLASGVTLVSASANSSTTASVSIRYAAALARITITPVSTTATYPAATTFSVEGFDSTGDSLGDLTTLALLTISDGTCTGAVCTGVPGSRTVTAAIGSVTDQFSLTIAALPAASTDISDTTDTETRTLVASGSNTPLALLGGAGIAIVAGVAVLVIGSGRRHRAGSAE